MENIYVHFFIDLESREAFWNWKIYFLKWCIYCNLLNHGRYHIVPIIVEEKDMISSFSLVRDIYIYFIQLKNHSDQYLVQTPQESLGGGFKKRYVHPQLGEMIPFDEHIFQMGWNHQPNLYLDIYVLQAVGGFLFPICLTEKTTIRHGFLILPETYPYPVKIGVWKMNFPLSHGPFFCGHSFMFGGVDL